MRLFCIATAGALALAFGGSVQAQAGSFDAAAAFGERESLEQVKLSPDGKHIVYVAPYKGKGSVIYTVDLATRATQQLTAVDGKDQRLGNCGWVANDRLLCSVFALKRVQGDIGGASVFVAMDVDGSDIVTIGRKGWHLGRSGGLSLGSLIEWPVDSSDSVLMTVWSGVRDRQLGLGVFRIDTRTDKAEPVQPAIANTRRYMADGQGQIRLRGDRRVMGATGMETGEIEYRFRPRGSDEWKHFGIYSTETRDGMNPLAIDAERNAVYALDKLDGRTALYRVALDGSGKRELLLANEKVDVDGVLRLGRRGRVIGGTYAEERRRIVYFDPELRALAEQLSKVLPNLPLIEFVGASDDEQVLLIWAGSDRDPGRYYTYDKRGRHLNEIMLARPKLENVALAEVRPVEFPAGDGTKIPGYLTLPPGSSGKGLPAIVMPHGGPASRDEWGFDWLAQYFANRGFAVLQPNFRGSAGYGDQWFLENGFKSWHIAIGDVNDAGRWLIGEGVADPSRMAIVGWSYGGYAALQSGVLDPALYRAVIAIAPVTDLRLLTEEARGWSNYRLMRALIGGGQHVERGSPAANAQAINIPVLMFHGDHDTNVDIRHSHQMERSLRSAGKRVELISYPGLDHGLQDSTARIDMLRRSDAFLRKALKM